MLVVLARKDAKDRDLDALGQRILHAGDGAAVAAGRPGQFVLDIGLGCKQVDIEPTDAQFLEPLGARFVDFLGTAAATATLDQSIRCVMPRAAVRVPRSPVSDTGL